MLGIRRRIKKVLRGASRRDSRPLSPATPPQPASESATQTAERPLPAAPAPQPKAYSFAAAARVASSVQESSPSSQPENETRVSNGFWGPVDNESARDKAAGKTLQIDRNECIGCGTCVENTEQVFFLNDDECKAYVIAQEGDMELVQDAIDACPVTCISWD